MEVAAAPARKGHRVREEEPPPAAGAAPGELAVASRVDGAAPADDGEGVPGRDRR